MKAYVFPGQGSQFVGMGKDLYERHPLAKDMFEKANNILGFRITDIMFDGTNEELKQTKVTQPAVFIHSVISAICLGDELQPDMVAGHSLGEFSALVICGALKYEDAIKLVYARALAMQEACNFSESTMAAIIALPDEKVIEVCKEINKPDNIVIPANFNCPGQVVISGHVNAVKEACEKLKEAGAKRAIILPVSGAFHSPLMQMAKDKLAAAIETTKFSIPKCPIYQNVNGEASIDPIVIKKNLIDQLTSSVLWTKEVNNMVEAGATEFIECGPGKVLQGMILKICRGKADVSTHGIAQQ